MFLGLIIQIPIGYFKGLWGYALLNTEIEKESLLNQEYKVLDKGFLKSIDYMGSDAGIVQAARISYRGEKH